MRPAFVADDVEGINFGHLPLPLGALLRYRPLMLADFLFMSDQTAASTSS